MCQDTARGGGVNPYHCVFCLAASAAKEQYPQPVQQQAPYVAKAHPAFSEPQKLPQPAPTQYQQVTPYQNMCVTHAASPSP